MEIIGIEMASRSREYDWEPVADRVTVPYVTLGRDAEDRRLPFAILIQRLHAALGEMRPDAVALPGWSHPVSLAALEWCGVHQVPAVLMSESCAWDEPRKGWKEWIKARIVRRAGSALVGGRCNAEYVQGLGMAPNRISAGYDVVDNEYFSREAEKWRAPLKDGGQSVAGGGAVPYLLASNRFVEKKNLGRLLEAYARYARMVEGGSRDGDKGDAPVWPLVLLGDGELRVRLIAHCAGLGLAFQMTAPWEGDMNPCALHRPLVFFPGFRQYEELPRFYGGAGAFVHASTTEQWGLVVNEAMACGLPVLVSKRCGCAADLVNEGANGFTFDPYDIARLAELMVLVCGQHFPRDAFGHASRQIVAQWGLERFGEGLRKAVDVAVVAGRPRIGMLDRLLLRCLQMRRYP